MQVQRLVGGGGFSGSELWKVAGPTGVYCLRRWPEATSAERLAFIHAFQRHLRSAGLSFTPLLMGAPAGRTFVEHQGHLWELATWMPGKADYHERLSPERLEAAMTALAQIHEAAATMPGQSRVGTSPGLAARLDQLRQLRGGGIEQIEAAVARRSLAWDDMARVICQRFRQFAPQIEQRLADATTIRGPLFPCLRDIWRDHVLFTGEEVTGIIDFGAARIESPAGDIARLVGSLVGDDAEGWDAARAAYEALRPLDASQQPLIRAFDVSGVLLSGVNWLAWLYVERRAFEDAGAVTRRLAEIAARLERVG